MPQTVTSKAEKKVTNTGQNREISHIGNKTTGKGTVGQHTNQDSAQHVVRDKVDMASWNNFKNICRSRLADN